MGSSTPEVGGGELGITTGTRYLEDGLTAWAWVGGVKEGLGRDRRAGNLDRWRGGYLAGYFEEVVVID
ncbi:hypothetical protein M0R45_031223 [Rubus argutus]|uniref:Uncharacterized protein n=1 Tax=Rubus argutus TaxID=59490 RepID=A0AAW1WFX3_RUBAR